MIIHVSTELFFVLTYSTPKGETNATSVEARMESATGKS